MEATDLWPLVGRDEELKMVVGVLDSSSTETAFVIAGRAGVGKTRLAREAASVASGMGWAVRWVVGTGAGQSVPLGAFAHWAGGLDGNPVRIVSELIAAVTSDPQHRPVLVAVDDAHLLDDLSALVLHQLVLRASATVIATLRSGEQAPDAVTALWKDGQARRLDLQPLSRPQSDALLDSVLGGRLEEPGADGLWRLTAGNVLFLRHVVMQELSAGRLSASPGGWRWVGRMAMSESLIDLIDAQVGAVPAAAGDVIDLVCLAEPLEVKYLRLLAEPDVIADCEHRGLISISSAPDGDTAQVTHPLYGEARLARSGRIRCDQLRGKLASAMARHAATDSLVDPVRLGQLWLASDLPPDPAVLTAAAHGAYARLDVELAAQLAEAAVDAGAGPDTRVLLAHVLSVSSQPERTEEILVALAASELPAPLRSVLMQVRCATLLWTMGQPEASWAVIDEALADPSPTVVAEALAFRTIQLATAGRPAEVLETDARIDHDRLGSMPAVFLAWARTIALGDLGQQQLADDTAQEAIAATATSPEAAIQIPAVILDQVQALTLGGDLARAQAVAENAYQEFGDVLAGLRTFTAAISGIALTATGDISAALQRLRAAVIEPDPVSERTGVTYHLLIVYLETVCYAADSTAISQTLASMQRFRHPACVYLEPRAQLANAWASAAARRLSEAHALSLAAADRARTQGQHAWEVRCLQAAIQFGDTGQAHRLTELAEIVEGPRAQLIARWAEAAAHHDAQTLMAVSADLEAMGDRIAAADASAHAALAFRRGQQRGPALNAAARAGRLITECGATTPATRTAATPLPLTKRERETAELLATGLSNKQIADALTLSVRTVEGHVYNSCTKLGLADRNALAQFMSELTAPIRHNQHPSRSQ